MIFQNYFLNIVSVKKVKFSNWFFDGNSWGNQGLNCSLALLLKNAFHVKYNLVK